jgi:hypothetical protein
MAENNGVSSASIVSMAWRNGVANVKMAYLENISWHQWRNGVARRNGCRNEMKMVAIWRK